MVVWYTSWLYGKQHTKHIATHWGLVKATGQLGVFATGHGLHPLHSRFAIDALLLQCLVHTGARQHGGNVVAVGGGRGGGQRQAHGGELEDKHRGNEAGDVGLKK